MRPVPGEKLAGHEDRMVRFATAGYAFLFVDTRGNGAETPGYSFNPQLDYDRYTKSQWPQAYEIVCDLDSFQHLLTTRFNVPVYAMGSSNGGRYAAIATASDPSICRLCRDIHFRFWHGWRSVYRGCTKTGAFRRS